jgi:hypothetical protein
MNGTSACRDSYQHAAEEAHPKACKLDVLIHGESKREQIGTSEAIELFGLIIPPAR